MTDIKRMSDIKSVWQKLALSLLAGGLLAASTSLHPVWWTAWFAAAPALLVAFRSRWAAGFGWAFLSAAIGGIPMFIYLLAVVPPALVTVFMGLFAAAFAAGVVVAAAVRRALPSWIAVFAFPAYAAAFDMALAGISPHGTALSFAYSQMDFAPVLQVAALGGTPAIVFVVDLVAAALAFLIAERPARRRTVAGVVIAGLVAAVAVGGGALRIAAAPTRSTTVVALAAIDQPTDLPADWRAVLAAYRPRVADAAASHARLVVLPEEIARVPLAALPQARAMLSSWAKAANATLAVGLRVGTGRVARNRLLVFGADGIALHYDKVHLIPGIEVGEVTPGTLPPLSADIAGLPLGGAICKDFDFPETARLLSRSDARIVVAPAWDFGIDAWLHSRMAVLRGVEGGFTLVRSARRGEMTVSDAYGRVIAAAPSGATAPTLVVNAPVPNSRATIYASVGDLFGWACAALVALLLARLVVGAIRIHRAEASAGYFGQRGPIADV
jgi:apolipoprotein N-acyltransferase